ncbi:MAG TPA: transposase [Gammaproteobacteria bacterium]|nr:transposase [Gammaproteobacteria bacterium]
MEVSIGRYRQEVKLKRKRFTEEQIVCILREAEASGNASEVCRRENIAQQIFYNWKRKYAGMEVSDVARLKALEKENGQLKKIVADLTLDNRILKEVVSKKW